MTMAAIHYFPPPDNKRFRKVYETFQEEYRRTYDDEARGAVERLDLEEAHDVAVRCGLEAVLELLEAAA